MPNDKSSKIKKINKKINTYKTKYESKKDLTNFREVKLGNIGENNIYRSYHPFKKSRPKHPLESKRIYTLKNLIKKNKINSIINLSDTNTNILDEFNYYKKLYDQGKVIFINKGYNHDVFYYITDTKNFATLLKRIINFIIKNPSPHLVHCRIGTDRTGVIIAILSAFMGAKWENIVLDYKRSNKLGIGEYRDEKLLKYAFQNLLNDYRFTNNLQNKINNYFINKVGLSNELLTELKKQLK